MMNVLAIVLVATSLAAAGVWSPPVAVTTPKQVVDSDASEVIVKEGHRVIVVEYDKEQTGVGNTKVSISQSRGEGGSVDPPEVGGGVKEIVCDAFGKCKHVITSVVGGGKTKVSDLANEVGQEVKGVGDKVTEKAEVVKNGAKDVLVGAKDGLIDKTQQGAEMVKEGARKGADKAKDAVHKAEKGVHNVRESVTSVGKEMAEKAKTKGKEGAEFAEEAVENVAEKVKAGAEKVKEEGKQELREIYDLGKQLMRHIWSYLAWGRMLDSVMGLVHLLGFCMAYGMAVWVTFALSNVLSRELPRQQYGVLQSKMYPVYFRAMGYCVGMSLLGHLLAQRRKLGAGKAEMFQGYNLAFTLGMVMINLYYLEPKATKVMFERLKEEKEEGRGREPYSVPEPTRTTTESAVGSDVHPKTTDLQHKPSPNDNYEDRMFMLSQKLKKFNSQSSLVNALSLMSLTWHLVYLSQRVNAC